MKNQVASLETIIPRLHPGQIEDHGAEISFRRASDGHATSLPKSHEIYLRSFVHGRSVESTILDLYARGKRPVFADLKNTLLRLYWAGDLKNAREFAVGIGMSDWVPTENSALLQPLFEKSYFQSSLLAQLAMLVWSLGSIFTVSFLLVTGRTSEWTLLLVPQAFFNLSFFVSTFLNKLGGDSPFQIAWKVTPLGAFLEGDYAGTDSSRSRWLQFAAGFVICICGSAYLKSSEFPPLFTHFGVRLCALFLFLLLSPVHNSTISRFYSELLRKRERDENGSPGIVHFFAAVTYGFLAFFLLAGVVRDSLTMFAAADSPAFVIGNAVFTLVLGGIAIDLRDDLKFLRNLARESGDERPGGKAAKESLAKRILARTPVFDTLPETVIDKIALAAEVVRISRGVILCKQGHNSTDLYIVIKGRIGIYHKSTSARNPTLIVELEAGSIFGEVGFFCGLPRTGDAIALTSAALLRLPRPRDDANAALNMNLPAMAIFQKKLWAFQALANSPLFSRLPSEILMAMVNVGAIVEAPANATVIGEGAFPDSMWILVQGACRFSSPGKMTHDLGPGAVLGEVGVIWNAPRTGTVEAKQTSLFLRLDALAVRRLLSRNLNLGQGLEELGEQRLQHDAAA